MTGKHIHIYVPYPLRNTMLHDIHDATHPGLRTTLREATRLYYWPNIIIIIIKKDWQCKAGRGRLTPYQS